MFSRSFWRFISLVSATGAGIFLARSFRRDPIALPDKTGELKSAARKTVRRAAAKVEEAIGGDGSARAH